MNLLLLALVPACFALNPVTGRALSAAFGPATLTLTRWLLSALIIALVVLAREGRERWRAPTGLFVRLAILGALSMGFCSYSAFEGVRTTSATNVGLIYACTAALVAAWEIVARRQRATVALVLGIVACIVGVAVLLTRGHPGVLRELAFTPGDLWAAAGMVVFAGYTVAMRRTPGRLTPSVQFTVMSLAASLAVLPLAGAEIFAAGLPTIDRQALIWIAVTVLVTGIGAYLGYNVALARNGPVLTAASTSLVPIYTAAFAVLLIGEQLARYHVLALLLVVAGLALINRDQARG